MPRPIHMLLISPERLRFFRPRPARPQVPNDNARRRAQMRFAGLM